RSVRSPRPPTRAPCAAVGSCVKARRAGCRLQIPAQGLLALDRLEQRLEVALAEAARAVPLDHLEEEGRAVLRGLREDLQQVALVVAVGEDAQSLQVAVVLFDLADAALDVFVVR